MRLTISTLFFYKPDLCKEFITAILPSVVDYAKTSPDTIQFVISDNTPARESVLAEMESLVRPHQSANLNFVLQQNEFNLGFGPAHNLVFQNYPSDIFIVLNNDLFIESQKGKNWIDILCAPLRGENKISIVGVSSSPSVLTADGEGRWKDSETTVSDYAEGSILAIRSTLSKALGLFSTDLDIAYFEDSDLSLRYRQAGYVIQFVDLPHEHRRGSSSGLVDPDLLTSIRLKNKSRFLKRWRIYLEKRLLNNRIFLDFQSGGWGDVIAAIPVVSGMLRDHPTAEIELQTNQVGLKNIFAGDRVRIRTENFLTPWQARDSGRFDRVFSLAEVDYSSPLHLGMQMASLAGTDFDADLAKAWVIQNFAKISAPERALAKTAKKIAVIHLESIRPDWEGRSLNVTHARESLEFLKSENYHLVLVGGENKDEIRKIVDSDLTGKTSLEDIFSLMKEAALFFGMDSGPLHVAQLFGVPTFAVFGATLPTARLLHLENSFGYFQKNLNCIGCYHQKIQSPRNYCIRRDEACVKAVDANLLKEKLQSFLRNGHSLSPLSALQRERTALSFKQILSLDSQNVRHPSFSDARLRQLLIALKNKIIQMIRDRF